MECKIADTLDYVLFATRHMKYGDISSATLMILIDLGFQTHTEGFAYLHDAILLRHNSPNIRLSEIYKKIEQNSDYDVGYMQIEQAIRSSIEAAWRSRESDKWGYFFHEKQIKEKRPSNKVFISQIACILGLWRRCREESYETR